MHGDSPGTLFLGELGVVLVAALVAGLAARTLRLPVLVGYLLAGVLVGPHTPGFIADEATVRGLADLGIVLLMFAVGIQFSLDELKHVRRTALGVGGAMLGASIGLGLLIGLAFGWGAYGGLFLGCALFLSSTAVMLRILDERGELGSTHGGIMLGILVVQDLSFVVMAVLLPALGTVGREGGAALAGVGLALLKAVIFLVVTLVLATRVVPFLLGRLARTGSRELFLLSVVGLCLLTAYAAERMGLGVALGAFLAGLVVSESPYSHEVFAQIRPLRDIFAAMFFVSVGMLLDPTFVAANWIPVTTVTLAIVVGKALATFVGMTAMGQQRRTALKVSLGLAQIGEFSFVLASLGAAQGLVSEDLGRIILSAALITLLLTPFVFDAAAPIYRLLHRWGGLHLSDVTPRHGDDTTENIPMPRHDHVIVLGYGRVGRYVSDALRAQDIPHIVADYDADALERLQGSGIKTIFGDVTAENVLHQLRPAQARLAVVALPGATTSETVVRLLKAEAPDLPVIVRVHRGPEIPQLRAAGADGVIHAEFEAGTEMIRQGLHRLNVADDTVEAYLETVRQRRYRQESDEEQTG